METIIVILIFIATYIALGMGKIHRVVVALSGASLILLFHVLNFNEAFYSPKYGVDYSVIVLLLSMMIIVNITKETGIFEWIAVKAIKDPDLLKKALIVLFGIIIGFFVHDLLGLEPAVVALIGATLMLGISKTNVHEMLEKVEWTTLFFFGGLFIVVGSMVKVGIIQYASQKVLKITNTQSFLTSTIIL